MTISPTIEQRRIVQFALDEPLRVSAGAGTGKTTTIVLRLQAAIAAGMAPEQALGLTFTNKAAGELSDRLRTELPDLAAEGREVEVGTYHGFAYGLLREFGAYVGVERDVRLIGPGYVRELIHDELATGDGYEFLDLTSPPHRVGEVALLMRQLADNLASTATITSQPRPTSAVAGKRWELAQVAQRVATTKQRLGLVDYGDLVRLVHRLLSDNPFVAARIAARYRMVQLDEYQDTDPGQREMLRLLFGGGFPITAVGDADQTIYEWRGASLANFTDFPEHFPTREGVAAITLPLSTNRRSAPPILALANSIREMLYGGAEHQPLTPAESKPGIVAVARYHSVADEAVGIAQEVTRLADENGVAWRHMAVLFRKNAQIPLVRDAFEAYDIPFEVAALGGLLSVPVVADLRAWLNILNDPADAPSMLRVLLGGSFRLGLGDLKPLADWSQFRQRRADEDDEGPPPPLLEAIDSVEAMAGLSETARLRLERFRSSYRHLLIQAQGVSLVELARRVLDATDAWAEIDALPPNASLTARLNLYRFLDLAEEWSPLQGRPSLNAFLGYLETLDEDSTAQELDTARVGDENVVALLTIHRAKGLEWENVFLPAVVKDILPASYRGGDNPHTAPAALPYELRIDREHLPILSGDTKEDRAALSERHLRQELRTAYVGVTRAKQRLYVSGSHWYTEGRPKGMSPVMDAALSVPGVVVGTMVDDPGEAPGLLRLSSPAGAPDPLFAGGWEAALRLQIESPDHARTVAADPVAYDEAMEQTELMLSSLPVPADSDTGAGEIVTSVTGLVTLAGCPRRFYWSEIDPLPRRTSSAMQRGVEVHRLIELHALGQVPLWDVAADLYDTTDADAPGDGARPFETFMASRFSGRRARFVEVPIELSLGQGRIRGRIDAVYEDGPGEWEIVDWKSGRASQDPTRVIQLEAYAVAASMGLIGDQVPDRLRVSFCYLGGNEVEEVGFAVTPEWLEAARSRLAAALTAAAGPEYDAHPGDRCRTCDFARFCDAGKQWLASTGV